MTDLNDASSAAQQLWVARRELLSAALSLMADEVYHDVHVDDAHLAASAELHQDMFDRAAAEYAEVLRATTTHGPVRAVTGVPEAMMPFLDPNHPGVPDPEPYDGASAHPQTDARQAYWDKLGVPMPPPGVLSDQIPIPKVRVVTFGPCRHAGCQQPALGAPPDNYCVGHFI